MTRGGLLYYFHQDPLGSVWNLTNSSEVVQNTYQYQAFGATYGTVTEAVTNPYRFTGRTWDAASATHHNRARQYAQTLGRFHRVDPLGASGGSANLFAYVGSSPLNFTDPLGLEIVNHPGLPGSGGDGNGGNLGGSFDGADGGGFAGDPNVPPSPSSGGATNVAPAESSSGTSNVSPTESVSSGSSGNIASGGGGDSNADDYLSQNAFVGYVSSYEFSAPYGSIDPYGPLRFFGDDSFARQQQESRKHMTYTVATFWDRLGNTDWVNAFGNASQGFARELPLMAAILNDLGHDDFYEENEPAARGGRYVGVLWDILMMVATGGVGCTPCFAAGTEVLLAPESDEDDAQIKSIEDVEVGDVVLARNTETTKTTPGKVVRVFRRTSDHLRIVRIRSSDGAEQEIKTTDEHPFYVADVGWVAAGRLVRGDKLLQADGRLATVESIRYEGHPEGIAVFNFEVQGEHTYFVVAKTGCEGVLVHNSCDDIAKSKALRESYNRLEEMLKEAAKNRLPQRKEEIAVTMAKLEKMIKDLWGL